jgi:hypothetical protein
MFATATVVEIDNRLTRQRFKLLIGKPRGRLLADLREAIAQAEQETLLEGPDAIEACVLVDSWGAIRVVIYPAETTGTAATVDRFDNERTAQPFTILEAADERHLVDVLADNLRRLMEREGITPDILAGRAGICPERLAEILDKRAPAAFLDEICNLAECLGTTTDALISRPSDQGADGWN